MRQKKSFAFTLVELIVVITILAILGTLAFISLQGYSKDARNSTRINDMKVISRGLDLYYQKHEIYPLPDDSHTLTYSGGIAWYQGVFGSGVFQKIQRVSNIPVDPVTGTLYSYSTLGTTKKYQLSAAFEAGLFSKTSGPTVIATTYAFTSNELKGYTLGNFISPSILVRHGGSCSILTSPSIILSDFPSGNILVENQNYNYSYISSPHIPASYSGKTEVGSSANGFPLVKVFSGCTMDTMEQLELYIAELSTVYQSLASLEKYELLVYQSHTKNYKKEALGNPEEMGLSINPVLRDEMNEPLPQQSFGDNFQGGDGTLIIGGYTPSSGTGSWELTAGGNASSYQIQSNRLRKIDGSNTLLSPVASPTPLLPNSTISFEIGDFAGGYIEVYLRYKDANNYYKLRVSQGNYEISRRLAGVDAIFNSISDNDIQNSANIDISILGNSLVLSVNENEKENIVGGGIESIGKNALYLQNSGAEIDNFSFTYQ